MGLIEELSHLPTYSQQLALDLTAPADRFKWFLASLLFGRRISHRVAVQTYRELDRRGLLNSTALLNAGWDALVEALDSGGYVRYDFSTASRLLDIVASLEDRYGTLDALHHHAQDSKDLERKLLAFRGVGPGTVNIFLRELRGIWEKARPPISTPARDTARRLSLSEEAVESPTIESALVRLQLEFCKAGTCAACPVRDFCAASP